jgi:DNA-binding response OmpR family regulator
VVYEKTLPRHTIKPDHPAILARIKDVAVYLHPLCSILLVEDHYDTRQAFAAILRSWGHEVATSDSAATALKFLDEREVDVVVSDIGLPDRNGYELVAEARHRRPGLATIAVSAYFTADDQKRGSDAGFDMFFAKPVDLTALRHVLERTPAVHPGSERINGAT